MRAYRSLLAGAAARRLALASVLGWLGFGALSLGIVLTVQLATGSSSAAGAALAGFRWGRACSHPRAGGSWTGSGRDGRCCRSRWGAAPRCWGSRSRRRRTRRHGCWSRWRRWAG